MQRGTSWQEQLVTDRLEDSTCVFVGMSLADPNLIRYLYGYKAAETLRHVAIFVRQGEPEVPAPVRASMEEAASRRWGRCGVEAIFVDHFADAAQLLYEMGHRKLSGAGAYQPVGQRIGEVIACAERGLAVADQEKFAKRQVALSTGLRMLLNEIVPLTLSLTKLELKETLSLALWLFSEDGSGLIGWAHSDRAHQGPSTVSPGPRCCHQQMGLGEDGLPGHHRGARQRQLRFTLALRQGLAAGLEELTRMPIGALTISSTVPAEESVLTKMPEDVRAALHAALQGVALRLLEAVIDAGRPASAAATAGQGKEEE